MELQYTNNKKYSIIRVNGPIESGYEFDFENVLQKAIDDKIKLIIDFKKCPRINSAALHSIVHAHQALAKSIIEPVALISPGKSIKGLLKITGLRKLFFIAKDIDVILAGDNEQ